MKGGVVVAVVALLAVAAAVQRGEAVTCGQVDVALLPCVDFLTGREADPPQPCCNGVREVKALAVAPADKRTVCGCVKAAAIRYTGLVDRAAQSLPGKCDVTLDIPVSRTVDCDRVIGLREILKKRDQAEEEGRYYIY